jgi:glycosyltransferase involved in cell wall biosynthesis
MTLPLVSIVTPAYNQAKYLPETINSVLAQDYKNIEYVVIDDGSTDGTVAVMQQYAGQIRGQTQANMGQALTLNKGWNQTSGKYVGYLSSDDVLLPSAISKLLAILEADESIVCAFPDADLIDEQSRVVKKNVCRAFNLAELVVRQECYIGPGAIFRRSAFNSVGGWKAALKLAPDREFWMRLASCGTFHFCNEVLAGYRIHPQSISYKDVSESTAREYIKVLDHYFSQGAVPPAILARKAEAYGYATLVLARNAFRSGNFARGMTLYKQACELHPDLKKASVKARLLRNVVSKPVRVVLSLARSAFKR